MKALLLAFLFTILIASQANAQSTLALQEKCAEIVKKSLGEGGITTNNVDMKSVAYTSHYNKKLDKCFALINYTLTGYSPTTKGQIRTTFFFQELWNAIERKQIGFYCSYMDEEALSLKESGCKVGDRICHSKTEFEALIKPYMEQ